MRRAGRDGSGGGYDGRTAMGSAARPEPLFRGAPLRAAALLATHYPPPGPRPGLEGMAVRKAEMAPDGPQLG